MVARLGKRPQGTDEAILWLVGELSLARVEWWWRPDLWWPVPTTASSKAAAGVRVSTGVALGSMTRGAEGSYGLLGMH